MYRELVDMGDEALILFTSLIGTVVRVETPNRDYVGNVRLVQGCDVYLDLPSGGRDSFCCSYSGPFLVTTVNDRYPGNPEDEPDPHFP